MSYIKEPYSHWTNSTNNLTYFFYKTKDNSISVSIKSENYSTELMHSVDGAFSETLYLYEDVVKYVFNHVENDKNCHFLSLGLGMGYVEMLVCAYAIKNFPNKNFTIFSFEKEKELKDFFIKFVFDENIPQIFKDTYVDIMQIFCNYYGLKTEELKLQLKNKIENKQIILYDEYNLQTNLNSSINGLFFDAFSFNTSPELWADELLEKILSSCENCAAFATYASRTHLKKLLLAHGFKLEKKQGYGGKKESTFACRV